MIIALVMCSILSIICLNKAMNSKESVKKETSTENVVETKSALDNESTVDKAQGAEGITLATDDEAEQQEEEAEDLSLSEQKENCPVCVLNKKIFGFFNKIANFYYLYISSLFYAPVEAPTIADKIDKTYEQLSEYLSTYYGEAAKPKLVELFKQQNDQFTEIVQYVKEDNKQLEGKSLPNISSNAKTIASLVGSYNSKADAPAITSQFEQFYNLLLRIIENRTNGDWTNAINLLDDVTISAQELSDSLASGIIDGYPDKFK